MKMMIITKILKRFVTDGVPRNYPASQKGYLVKHISNVHDIMKDYSCNECDMKCSRLNNLNQHKEAKHSKTYVLNSSSLPSSPVVTEFIPHKKKIYSQWQGYIKTLIWV